MNHTTHLDLPSFALKVLDTLFKSLEVRSRQIEITVISGTPKQLRKQSEKSSFDFLGRLRLHICVTGLRVDCPRCLTIYVKMTDIKYRHKISCQKRLISSFRAKSVLSGEQCTRHQPVRPDARRHPFERARARARPSAHCRAPVCPRDSTSLRVHACTYTPRTSPLHACTCMYVRAHARPPVIVTRLPLCTSTHVRALSRAPELSAAPMHTRARPAACQAHLNVLSSTPNALPSVPPSHPTLEHFPNSFLVS
ncbi:hypothetical protein CRG98_007642 [Punica granatum]|uniref:Uncharacterized protein n=1 Tax=Punica granatum TaxID=22663 RepID=A0A2I0KU21_PUNGR|nr:hypothetical protein CRG98_007642 [Punica granatum]